MGVAKMAGRAFIRQDHPGMVLAGIHRQDFRRAELHADAAAFAPGGIDDHLAARSFSCRGRCDEGAC